MHGNHAAGKANASFARGRIISFDACACTESLIDWINPTMILLASHTSMFFDSLSMCNCIAQCLVAKAGNRTDAAKQRGNKRY